MKKILLRIATLFIIFIGIGLLLVAPIDRQHYREQAYYRQTMQALDSLEASLSIRQTDSLKAGWSRKNITPAEKLHLMGYGWKGDYEAVHDSLMLRCFVFDNGQKKIALLSYDLMIVHPDLAQAICHAADTAALSLQGIYFSAVHTHKGYGEWAKGLSGRLTAGGYNPELVDFMVRQSLAAIREAGQRSRTVEVGYAAFSRPDLLRNRLTRTAAADDSLRVLKLAQPGGETALLCTYAAHATFISSRSMELSADYPGQLVKALERHPSVDFAAYAAGAVGSHSPVRIGDFTYAKMEAYAENLAAPLLDSLDVIATQPVSRMCFARLPLRLGGAQLKIAEQWRVRPWLFETFFGKLQPKISLLMLEDVVLMGVPADFSGMLYDQLQTPPFHLMISSFSGSYIGYVIPDTHYGLPHREARELNWFGPYTGSYVSEVMGRLLEILAGKTQKKRT